MLFYDSQIRMNIEYSSPNRLIWPLYRKACQPWQFSKWPDASLAVRRLLCVKRGKITVNGVFQLLSISRVLTSPSRLLMINTVSSILTEDFSVRIPHAFNYESFIHDSWVKHPPCSRLYFGQMSKCKMQPPPAIFSGERILQYTGIHLG